MTTTSQAEGIVERLRSALDDLIKAAEPLNFSEISSSWSSDLDWTVVVKVGDLRSLSDAVRKAKEVK